MRIQLIGRPVIAGYWMVQRAVPIAGVGIGMPKIIAVVFRMIRATAGTDTGFKRVIQVGIDRGERHPERSELN